MKLSCAPRVLCWRRPPAPRHVLVLLGADVDCPCRRHDHPRQNALVNYAGCRRWPSRPSGGLCGCWWPLRHHRADHHLLRQDARRPSLLRLSRGSHAAVHALMQRSSSRASSERDDSSLLPSRDTAEHACSQSDCFETLNRALRALKGCCRKELSL